MATVALIDDLLGDVIQEFPFLLCEFLVGEDAGVAQRGQLTKLGGDAGDRAAGQQLSALPSVVHVRRVKVADTAPNGRLARRCRGTRCATTD